MSDRSLLRAEVVEISGNRCEHPAFYIAMNKTARCSGQMTEMAHITSRGMGHKGDRDIIENVMAACTLHARSTDDLSSPEWLHVPGWHTTPETPNVMSRRQALAHYVNNRRVREGWAMS
jgi:hypothetical protein